MGAHPEGLRSLTSSSHPSAGAGMDAETSQKDSGNHSFFKVLSEPLAINPQPSPGD